MAGIHCPRLSFGSNDPKNGKLLGRYGGQLGMWCINAILDRESVRAAFLGASPQNELVVGSFFFGTNNGTVLNMH